MGNYRNIEIDFIERTLMLISQYDGILYRYEFDKQYNHTLLINCLLGLIVFPKERSISYLPSNRITKELQTEMGLYDTYLNIDYNDLKHLVVALRNSIAHFNIEFESLDEEFRIDKIVFKDSDKGNDYVIASFIPAELLSFIRYYANWFVSTVRKYKKELYETV